MNIGSVFEFGFSQRYPSLFRHAHNKMTAALYPYLKSVKVILHRTSRNDYFLRNTALQIAGTMLQPFESTSQQCCNAVLR